MLTSIAIENYALIDKLEMKFHEGLSIITGETGAGKSILIGALGLILGKRADTFVLKDKHRKCFVEGTFRIKGYDLEDFFKKHDLDYSDESIIRREIASSGKSRAFINDTPVNLNVLQELALLLVDIHSQHQNLLLNDEAFTLHMIDSYAGTLPLLKEYRTSFTEYRELKKEYYQARESYHADKENLDFISHQFTELSEAELKENELDNLEAEYKLINHAEDIKTTLANTSDYLEHDETGILPGMKSVSDSLLKISDHMPGARILAERLQSVYIELKDLAGEISAQNGNIDFDAERMQVISDRLDLLYSLLRKYKTDTIQNLIDIRIDLDRKLQRYTSGDFELNKLSAELKKKEELINKLATELSRKRTKIFEEFEHKVLSLLLDLGMKNVQFSVHHEMTGAGESGMDRIQFLFSANKNIPVQPVAKVASGGELSRLMLAVKYLISDSFGMPTIIFDEIDSGVSGEIADKVGNLIREMSSHMQVINITHLPQVASKGNHHYLVYKATDNDKSMTYIKRLDDEERLHEIAKMLSGDAVSEAAIENAKVLLNQQ
ncbi:MAG: DNA repair protein RecN [Bacteroidales bacterium]|jgi:DNA repair protein RecN (Recombination protein N)